MRARLGERWNQISFAKASAAEATQYVQNYHPRAQRQSLEILVSLPLDILFKVTQSSLHISIRDNHNRVQIFERLLPLDLLHLARTTKALCAALMHRSSTTVWMAARSI